jgi:hypothetical protein
LIGTKKCPSEQYNITIDRDKKCLSEQYNIMIGKEPAIYNNMIS